MLVEIPKLAGAVWIPFLARIRSCAHHGQIINVIVDSGQFNRLIHEDLFLGLPIHWLWGSDQLGRFSLDAACS